MTFQIFTTAKKRASNFHGVSADRGLLDRTCHEAHAGVHLGNGSDVGRDEIGLCARLRSGYGGFDAIRLARAAEPLNIMYWKTCSAAIISEFVNADVP
jgi:hypothetical protein